MRAKLIKQSTKGFPGYEPWEDVDVYMDGFTLGQFYEVIALFQSWRRCYLLLIDDMGRLSSRPSYCFELESNDIPTDWKITIFNEYETIIIGPEFISGDYSDFSKLLEYDTEMMDKLKTYYMGSSE